MYKAVTKANGRGVALKKVQIFDMADAKARTDCIKEIDLLKSLNHPNVIEYLCVQSCWRFHPGCTSNPLQPIGATVPCPLSSLLSLSLSLPVALPRSHFLSLSLSLSPT